MSTLVIQLYRGFSNEKLGLSIRLLIPEWCYVLCWNDLHNPHPSQGSDMEYSHRETVVYSIAGLGAALPLAIAFVVLMTGNFAISVIIFGALLTLLGALICLFSDYHQSERASKEWREERERFLQNKSD